VVFYFQKAVSCFCMCVCFNSILRTKTSCLCSSLDASLVFYRCLQVSNASFFPLEYKGHMHHRKVMKFWRVVVIVGIGWSCDLGVCRIPLDIESINSAQMDYVILWQDIGGYSERKFKKSSIKQWTCKISFGKIDVKLNDKNK